MTNNQFLALIKAIYLCTTAICNTIVIAIGSNRDFQSKSVAETKVSCALQELKEKIDEIKQ